MGFRVVWIGDGMAMSCHVIVKHGKAGFSHTWCDYSNGEVAAGNVNAMPGNGEAT